MRRYSYYIGDRHIATGTKKQIAARIARRKLKAIDKGSEGE